jgi:hypothetical protein
LLLQAALNGPYTKDGAFEVMRALRARGIGVEAGVWSPEDARALNESGLAAVNVSATNAAALVAAIRKDARDGPILQHGDGEATWILLGNVALVQRAMNLIRAGSL